jgi:gliding motility-associated-like protein
VTTTPPTVAGQVNSNNTVCSGANSTLLATAGSVGSVLDWISSPNGTGWTSLGATGSNYTAQNLTATTQFAALVQNGATCRIDTARAAIITVDAKTVPGSIQPSSVDVCLNQPVLPTLQLLGNTGAVVNWQQSPDNSNWNGLIPAYQQTAYQPGSVNATAYYRTIVKNGVCPADTSAASVIRFYNTPFPSAAISPDSSSICYGKSATLNASITAGTSYSWSNSSVVTGGGNGTVPSVPYNFTAFASPRISTDLVLTVNNAGCPNPYKDTFHINVIPPVKVFAGNDTAVIIGQPLQLNATSNIAEATNFNWTPSTGLSNAAIPNPLAVYSNADPTSITYVVTATTPAGCTGSDEIVVKIFRTGTDIFMPTAFTPNGDGRNDELLPVYVGISKLNYFRIYNRWGQLVFSTTTMGRGWDGKLSGTEQGSSNFVYMIEGVDYTGRVITKKGNLLLIR